MNYKLTHYIGKFNQSTYKVSISFSVISYFKEAFGNGFAPVQIFNAILSSLFSATAELALLKHPRRPTKSGSLVEQFEKAKSSTVASSIPKNLYFITELEMLPHIRNSVK